MSRWKYVGGSPNAARFSNVTIQGMLHLLALMRQGLQVHAGTQALIIKPAPVFHLCRYSAGMKASVSCMRLMS